MMDDSNQKYTRYQWVEYHDSLRLRSVDDQSDSSSYPTPDYRSESSHGILQQQRFTQDIAYGAAPPLSNRTSSFHGESQSPPSHQSLEIDGSAPKCSEAETPLLRKSDTKSKNESEDVVNEKKMVIIAILVKVSILLILVGAGFLVYWKQDVLKKWLKQFLTFVEELGVWGPVLLCFVYAILIAGFFPAELLILAAGFIFTRDTTFGFKIGFPLSTGCCFIAMILSSVINFFICRLWLFQPTHLLFRRYRFFRAFTRAVREGGAKFVALIRLSPVIPFAISNCLLGVTEITFAQVLLGVPFALPLITITTYIGSCLGDLDQLGQPGWEWDTTHIWVLSIGAIAGISAMAYIVYLTRQQLALASEEDRSDLLLQRSNTLHGISFEGVPTNDDGDGDGSTTVGDDLSPPISLMTTSPEMTLNDHHYHDHPHEHQQQIGQKTIRLDI